MVPHTNQWESRPTKPSMDAPGKSLIQCRYLPARYPPLMIYSTTMRQQENKSIWPENKPPFDKPFKQTRGANLLKPPSPMAAESLLEAAHIPRPPDVLRS